MALNTFSHSCPLSSFHLWKPYTLVTTYKVCWDVLTCETHFLVYKNKRTIFMDISFISILWYPAAFTTLENSQEMFFFFFFFLLNLFSSYITSALVGRSSGMSASPYQSDFKFEQLKTRFLNVGEMSGGFEIC